MPGSSAHFLSPFFAIFLMANISQLTCATWYVPHPQWLSDSRGNMPMNIQQRSREDNGKFISVCIVFSVWLWFYLWTFLFNPLYSSVAWGTGSLFCSGTSHVSRYKARHLVTLWKKKDPGQWLCWKIFFLFCILQAFLWIYTVQKYAFVTMKKDTKLIYKSS